MSELVELHHTLSEIVLTKAKSLPTNCNLEYMRQAEKIAVIEKILTAFLEDKGRADSYEAKIYLDILRSKIDLLMALLKNHLE